VKWRDISAAKHDPKIMNTNTRPPAATEDAALPHPTIARQTVSDARGSRPLWIHLRRIRQENTHRLRLRLPWAGGALMRRASPAALVAQAALLALLAATVCGCTMVSWTTPQGDRFTRTSLGANTAIAALTLETGTNGLRRVELSGYHNDSAQAMGAVTEAAIRAALQNAR
jgi:hypothetical protein